jgi:uncharacterized membrane-anchored protein YitT (DUF2179 family)
MEVWMKNWLIIGVGVVLTLTGLVWTLQGLNILPGSVMSGVTLWAMLGPVVGLGGLALIVWGYSRRKRSANTSG